MASLFPEDPLPDASCFLVGGIPVSSATVRRLLHSVWGPFCVLLLQQDPKLAYVFKRRGQLFWAPEQVYNGLSGEQVQVSIWEKHMHLQHHFLSVGGFSSRPSVNVCSVVVRSIGEPLLSSCTHVAHEEMSVMHRST